MIPQRSSRHGEYRALFPQDRSAITGKRKNLGTLSTRAGESGEKHEREVQYFRRH